MTSSRPNVLYIIAEDVGIQDYSCYQQNGTPSTLNVQQLANNGVVFSNAHSTAALCSPARYSLLTGNYPNRSSNSRGVWGFDVKSNIKQNQSTLANVLKNYGYRTGIFGKTGIGGKHHHFSDGTINWVKPMLDGPNTWGFDFSFVIPRGHQWLPLLFLENGIPTCEINTLLRGNQAFDFAQQMGCNNKGGTTESLVNKADYADPNFDASKIGETLLKKVEQFLDTTNNDQPFFMHFCCDGSHCPYKPPAFIRGNKILNISNSRRNDMVHETDILLGELVKILEKRNLQKNTVICFTADHGAAVNHASNSNLRGGKASIYQGGTKVPLILSYPPYFDSGVIRNELVCAMDITTTVLDLLGIPIANDQFLDAKSLMPLLNKADNKIFTRKALLINQAKGPCGKHNNCSALYYKKWKLIFKKNRDKNAIPLELYDLSTDILERNNLITDLSHRTIKDALFSLYSTLNSSPNTRTLPL